MIKFAVGTHIKTNRTVFLSLLLYLALMVHSAFQDFLCTIFRQSFLILHAKGEGTGSLSTSVQKRSRCCTTRWRSGGDLCELCGYVGSGVRCTGGWLCTPRAGPSRHRHSAAQHQSRVLSARWPSRRAYTACIHRRTWKHTNILCA